MSRRKPRSPKRPLLPRVVESRSPKMRDHSVAAVMVFLTIICLAIVGFARLLPQHAWARAHVSETAHETNVEYWQDVMGPLMQPTRTAYGQLTDNREHLEEAAKTYVTFGRYAQYMASSRLAPDGWSGVKADLKAASEAMVIWTSDTPYLGAHCKIVEVGSVLPGTFNCDDNRSLRLAHAFSFSEEMQNRALLKAQTLDDDLEPDEFEGCWILDWARWIEAKGLYVAGDLTKWEPGIHSAVRPDRSPCPVITLKTPQPTPSR